MALRYIDTKDLTTFSCSGEETHIGGYDDNGNEIIIKLSTYQLLHALNVPEMKEELNKYINNI
tara:strand:- start:551 stop:739 length:189 start_codon:yes stop_codon:yes gene_type:complete